MIAFDKFQASIEANKVPGGISNSLKALWFDAKEDWDKAHGLVQDEESLEAYWVHAYLHRKEGDLNNAAYWYSRAGKSVFKGEPSKEWEQIVQVLVEAT